MNKGELIDAIAQKLPNQVTKAQTDKVISAAMDAIIESVAAGEKVVLVGFGSFEKRERKERLGRNPQSGEQLTIAATSVPAFAPGKLFREKVAPDADDT